MPSLFISLQHPTSADATAVFSDPIKLDESKQYEIALQNASLYYTWVNVSSDFNNNQITYNTGIGADKTITFPKGNYGVMDLESYIHEVMKENGDFTVVSGVDTFDIKFQINYSTLRVKIVLTNSYSIDFTGTTFGDLMGFTNTDIMVTTVAPNNAEITRGVDSLYLKCTNVRGSYSNGVNDQVIYSFSPNSAPGTLITIEPNNLIWLELDRSLIREFRITLTDQLGRSVSTEGEGASYVLIIREIK